MRTKLILALLLAPSAALAQQPTYTFIQFDYSEIDRALVGDDGGWGFQGSAQINERFYFDGGFTTGDLTVADLNFDWGYAGFGLLQPLGDSTSLYAQLNYEYLSVGGFFGTVSDGGFGAEFGVRSMLTRNFELQGGIHYSDPTDGLLGDSTFYELGARFHTGNGFAFGLMYETSDAADILRLGVRYELGRPRY